MDLYFICDIDDTLISTKQLPGEDYVRISSVQGRDSVIRRDNLELLTTLRKYITIIPCTSRTLDSYKTLDRLDFPTALVDNGGTLISDYTLIEKWQEESRSHLNNEDQVQKVKDRLLPRGFEVKHECWWGADLLHPDFCSFRDIELAKDLAPSYNVHRSGNNGLLLEHQNLTKGIALHRFSCLHPGYYYAAGDGTIDDSLFIAANQSIGLSCSAANVRFSRTKHYQNPHDFANFVLRIMLDKVAD